MRRVRRARRYCPEITAFVLAIAAYAAAQIIGGRAPFGPGVSAINDMGDQFIPMHATLWDILHRTSDSDLFFTWSAAAGHPFLPDYVAYLSSPLNLVLLLAVPRSGVEVAVTAGVLLRMGLAAALMAHVLRRLRPALPPWAALLLGVAYGTCAWAVNDASYVPMWLDGFLGLPLILLAGLWARQRRRPVLGVLAVALVWWSNFYSAYMATCGAVLLLALVMLADGDGPRTWLTTAGRFAWRTAAGGLLAGLVLIPEMTAIGTSVTTTPTHVDDWLPLPPYVARLLPLTEGAGASPSLGFGTLPLLAALLVPLHPGLTRRQRIVLPLGVAALVVSTAHPTTYILWHLGIAPNGSAWREAFVIAAFGVVLAAYAASTDRPPPPARILIPAAVLLLAAWWVTGQSVSVRLSPHSISWTVLAVGVAVGVGGLARVVRRVPVAAPLRWAAITVLIAFVVVEQSFGAVVIAQQRDVRLPGSYVWSGEDARVAPALAPWRPGGGEWPTYRTSGSASTGTNGQNDGLLYGVPSLTYYSSTTQQSVSNALTGLGAPYAASGRIIIATDDPGLNALFGVDGMLRRDGRVERLAALPLVRLLTDPPPADATPGAPPATGTVFTRRNALFERPVYREPAVSASLDGAPVDATGDIALRAGQRLAMTVSCAPGSTVQVYARDFVGSWSQLGPPSQGGADVVRITHPQPRDWHKRGIEGGVAEPAGTATLTFAPAFGGSLPGHAVSCLDSAALTAAIATAGAAPRPRVTLQGSSMSVDLAAPSRDTLLVATAWQAGWSCTADGAEVAPQARAGLFTLPLTGQHEVRCGYTPPGLLRGAAASGAGLAMLLAMLGYGWWRRRGTGPAADATGAEPTDADLTGSHSTAANPTDADPAGSEPVRRGDADRGRAAPSPSPAR